MSNENINFSFEEKTPFYKNSKFYLFSAFAIIAIIVLVVFFSSTVKTYWTEKELLAALEVRVEDSYWVQKKGLHNETIIVPAISFTVKNLSQRELSYISFNGVFFFDENREDLGSGYLIAFKKKLKPSEKSHSLFLKSDYGYKASSLKAFYENQANWKPVSVRLYARISNTTYVLLGTYPIKQEIQGVKVTHQELPQNQDKISQQ